MKTGRMSALLFGLMILSLAACQTAQVAGTTKPTSVNLKPAQSHEDCAEVTPDNELTYSFMSTAPVDFNIHYHEGASITYPVQKTRVSSDSGTFRPDKKALYCLMWTNNNPQRVNVEYSMHVGSRSK